MAIVCLTKCIFSSFNFFSVTSFSQLLPILGKGGLLFCQFLSNVYLGLETCFPLDVLQKYLQSRLFPDGHFFPVQRVCLLF